MKHRNTQKTSTPAQDCPPAQVITGRPTVAGGIPRGMEGRLETADLTVCEFIRPPKPRQFCRLTSMSRSGVIAAAEAAGALVRVRLCGKVRGSVLIDRAKLLTYLRGLAAGGTEGQ
jgi:hypothetical protein